MILQTLLSEVLQSADEAIQEFSTSCKEKCATNYKPTEFASGLLPTWRRYYFMITCVGQPAQVYGVLFQILYHEGIRPTLCEHTAWLIITFLRLTNSRLQKLKLLTEKYICKSQR